jgi:ABC-type Zn uptake system ZnuABC Zn-binding protein ZnuA
MVRVARADIYLKVGLGLDAWANPIIDGSQNARLLIVDCSKGIQVLEKPTGKVDASMGDVHPDGNPHYWLDPSNGAVVARAIAAALSQVDPGHADGYAQRAEAFAAQCGEILARGKQAAAAVPGHDILTYHRSWSYFAAAFGLEVVATIEPIPGIPPTARQLQDLIGVVKERRVRVAIAEPYFSDDAPKFLERETGIRVLRESSMCAEPAAGSYAAHFDRLIQEIGGGDGS